MSNVQRFGAPGDGNTDDTEALRHAVRFVGNGHGNLIGANSIGPAIQSALSLADTSGVRVEGN